MNDSEYSVVLQRVGDHSPITLGDEKCLIRTILGTQRVDCCAIINGPNGTAIRSYRSGILVNGEPTSVRKLSTGDVIELPCQTKIEVQHAVEIRPVITGRPRSTEDVDQKLAKLRPTEDAAAANTPENSYLRPPTEEPEEKFLSPFSADLPEITSESFGQPVASTVSPENQLTPEEASSIESPTAPETLAEEAASVSENDLESIFAKVGVTNVGSIKSPESPVETPVPAPVEIPEPASATVDTSAMEEVASIRQQLETEPNASSETPNPETPVAPIASSPERTVPETLVAEAVSADEPTPAVDEAIQQQKDPLNVLPADLRDQLNDLVSSLENGVKETASQTASTTPTLPIQNEPASVEPTSSLPSAAAAAATTAAAAVAAATVASTFSTPDVPTEPDMPTPTPVPVTPTPAATAKPVAQENRSVADVLGAMGMSIPGDDEAGVDQPTAPVAASQPQQPEAVAPTAEPVTRPDQDVPTSPVFANVQNANAEEAQVADGNAEQDIQSYMNRLLNRDESTPQPQVAAPVIASNGVPVVQSDEGANAKIVPVLSEDEFVPTHKASRPENYDALRDLANNSNRNALQNSSKKPIKGNLKLKAAIAIIGLVGAATMYVLQQNSISLAFVGVAILGLILCALDGSLDDTAK